MMQMQYNLMFRLFVGLGTAFLTPRLYIRCATSCCLCGYWGLALRTACRMRRSGISTGIWRCGAALRESGRSATPPSWPCLRPTKPAKKTRRGSCSTAGGQVRQAHPEGLKCWLGEKTRKAHDRYKNQLNTVASISGCLGRSRVSVRGHGGQAAGSVTQKPFPRQRQVVQAAD